jgi:atypical dual specificity phosphatase
MKFIEEGIKSKGVLVHCRFGISRSASFVIAYLMKSKCQTFLASYKEVKRKRDLIKPNSGFTKQLMSFETKLKIKQ